MGQRRARQFHEKEARRQDILAAATTIWDRVPFQVLTMSQVARQTGLAKGTLYIYFKTKEELFLAMAEEDLLGWYEELDEALRRGPKLLSPRELASLVAGSLAGRPRLPRLLAILHTILEHNIPHLTALRSRQFLATRLLRTGRMLERRFPGLPEGRGAALALRIQSLVAGLWMPADPSPEVRQILDAPGLHMFRLDFSRDLEECLFALLAGLAAGAWLSPRPDNGG